MQTQQKEVARRVALYRQGRPFPSLKDRTVILVDDGLATGATFFASVATVRQAHPRRVIGARSVGPHSTVEQARSWINWWCSNTGPVLCRRQFLGIRTGRRPRKCWYLSLAEEAFVSRS
ncbi:MAG: hypothetical protein MRJ92_01575 [Nitrospira sp.]|nr:hypothetical protein [Nitrospira sp.]